MKNKALALTAVLFLMVSSAVAVSLNPGESGKLTDRVTGLQDRSTSIPVNLESNSSGVFVSVPGDLPAQSGEVVLDYSNGSESYDVTVNEFSDWGFNSSFRENVSVGDTGRLGVVNFTQNGNVQSDISVSASGNLTEFISFDDGFTVYPQNTITKTVSYSLPRDTRFGVYNASFNFTEKESNVSKVFNLSARFEDDIDPAVSSTSFPDVMSTKSEEFSVVVDENFDVSNVSADIVREVTAERNNETVLVNETVTTLEFERQGQIWKTEFSDTDDIGTYYYTVTATDAAGNTGNKTGMFRVQGLDAVNVLNNNFEFDSVYPKGVDAGIIDETQSKAKQQILEIDKETEVTVSLESFSHSNSNSSIKVGVLKPGNEVMTEFEGNEGSISFSEEGVYSLVVESDMVESFSGDLNVSLVPQHVGENNRVIEFSGLVTNPSYPPEQSWTLRGMNATLEYKNTNGDSQPDVLVRTLTADADLCKGFKTAEECPELNDFESIVESVKKENSRLTSSVNDWITFENFIFLGYKLQRNIAVLGSLFVLLMYFGVQNLEDQIVMRPYEQE